MLETKDLILDKGRFEDWEAMYRNVWRHPESARYMRVTDHPEDAPDRMRRNIQWQKVHDTYFVYLKTTGEAVGFAGVERISPTLWEEGGVCLGPDFVGKGYGKQILQCLLDYARAGGAVQPPNCMTTQGTSIPTREAKKDSSPTAGSTAPQSRNVTAMMLVVGSTIMPPSPARL